MKGKSESGLGLIEVMLSAMFLTVGLMAVGMTMVQGLSAMFIVQEQLVAKQKAREAMESVFTSRSTQNISFDQLRNVSSGGILLDGYKEIRGAGADGVANTADDSSAPLETVLFPGPDGQLGTGDDISRALTGFERSVTIATVPLATNNLEIDPDIRQITVSVRFKARGAWRTVTSISYISRFS